MPTAINNNIAGVHKKEWQQMNPLPVSTSTAGSNIISDQRGIYDYFLTITGSASAVLSLYSQDSTITLPSPALTAFGVGACGELARWSNSITATGGSTTTVTTTAAITGICKGRIIRFATGTAANIGIDRVITDVVINIGGTSTITFAALPSAVVNTDTFRIDTGLFYIMGNGTAASGMFRSYDPLTGVYTTLTATGLPTLNQECRLIATPSNDVFAAGTATAGGASTITNSIKTWTVNQWTNSQIRITAGTGIGQVRTIASNTATVITTSSAWTTAPDVTSQYEIAGNDDFLYLLGNGAITMYRYSISANTWTTMAPTVARAGTAPSQGFSANWVSKTGNANWANENNIQDGRYIYSFKGTAIFNQMERFDIAGGTAGAGAWATLNLSGTAEPASNTQSASCAVVYNNLIIYKLGVTNRYIALDVTTGFTVPLTTNISPESSGVQGHRIAIKRYQESGVDKLVWLYAQRPASVELFRVLLY
jgi:hypothetical protein